MNNMMSYFSSKIFLLLGILFLTQVGHLNAMKFSCRSHDELHRSRYGWNRARFDDWLSSQKFKDIQNQTESFLMSSGLQGIERRKLISWLRDGGCNGGHVPLLFMWIRLKTKNGAELGLSEEEFACVLTYVVISLIRTMQDVVCMQKIVGCDSADSLYDMIKCQYYNLLLPNTPMTSWPLFSNVMMRVKKWFKRQKNNLPLPAWAGNCNAESWARFSITFSSPRQLTIEALKRSGFVDGWRDYVLRFMLDHLSGKSNWNDFFNAMGGECLEIIETALKDGQ